MFTGIVQARVGVKEVRRREGLLGLALAFTPQLLEGLEVGASVAVNGVCLTVARIVGGAVQFEVVRETLELSNLRLLEAGAEVNVERAARLDSEIGGHVLSGHVVGTAEVLAVEKSPNNVRLAVGSDPRWLKFVFAKGFLAVNGASLTVAEVDRASGRLAFNLIPETLARTNLELLAPGDLVNIEVDGQTQAVVETVERVLAERQLA